MLVLPNINASLLSVAVCPALWYTDLRDMKPVRALLFHQFKEQKLQQHMQKSHKSTRTNTTEEERKRREESRLCGTCSASTPVCSSGFCFSDFLLKRAAGGENEGSGLTSTAQCRGSGRSQQDVVDVTCRHSWLFNSAQRQQPGGDK